MNKKLVFLSVAVACVAITLFPSEIVAETTAYGADSIRYESNGIKNFLFGPALRIAGILGGGYGVLMAAITSSMRPLVTFGGIGLGANLVPKFIDGVFAAGLLLN